MLALVVSLGTLVLFLTLLKVTLAVWMVVYGLCYIQICSLSACFTEILFIKGC